MDNSNTARVALARTLLFVPGHRPERFETAARSGADLVVLDLEDGVRAADKPAARAAIEREWPRLQTIGVPIAVRINAADSLTGGQDLDWLERSLAPAAVMLPKAESAEVIAQVHRRLNAVVVLPIIESAAGYAAIASLAAAPGVVRLVIGHLDFMLDTGMKCGDDQAELAPLRFAVAMATRLAELASAVDGVTVQIGNEALLRADVRRAMRFGFGGKLCIHPTQVDVVHQVMMPTAEEMEWARKVIAADAAAEGAAIQIDGRMVDLPVVLQARRTLARAAAAG